MAQLDSASVFGTEGYRFESYWVYFDFVEAFRLELSNLSFRLIEFGLQLYIRYSTVASKD